MLHPGGGEVQSHLSKHASLSVASMGVAPEDGFIDASKRALLGATDSGRQFDDERLGRARQMFVRQGPEMLHPFCTF